MNCTKASMSESKITTYVNNSFTVFQVGLIRPILATIVSWRFFAWISLGDVDFRFSLILVTLDNAAKAWTTSAAWLCHKSN